jgi:DNA-binding response OmpR family regulator
VKIAALQGRRILVVEDDYMIAQDVQDDLERAGAVVIGPTSSVSGAMNLLDGETSVDAAVLDINLGDERSFPVAEALQRKSVPFLFATGYNSADIPQEWRTATIVMKPLRIAAIEQLLSSSDPA